MPAPSLCAEPGCATLVMGGRCQAHARKPWKHATASRHQRGMGADHDRMRRIVIAEEDVCRACGSPDQPTLDRVRPRSQGGTLDRDNLQRLCGPCQAAKASHEGAAAKVR